MKVLITIVFLALLYDVYIQVKASIKHKDDVRQYLGSRTPYRFKSNKNDTLIKYPGKKINWVTMFILNNINQTYVCVMVFFKFIY